MRLRLFLVFTAASLPAPAVAAESFALQQFPGEIRPLVMTYCAKCHGGEQTKGDVNLIQYEKTGDVLKAVKTWKIALEQMESQDMPPEGKPQPNEAERSKLLGWLKMLVQQVEFGSLGKDPGRVTLRRLNRTEYNNTIQDLFGVKIRPADNFPADGSGGAGFDNNAATLFLPPILAEKYFEASGQIVDALFAHDQTRSRIVLAKPEAGKSADAAAKSVLTTWTSRIFRRRAEAEEVNRYLEVWTQATKSGATYDDGLRSAIKAMLLSPHFLFRAEKDQSQSGPYRISDFELASRLSYFLWLSTPDLELLGSAAKGDLSKPDVLEAQVRRLLKDPRSKNFSREFSSQWLGFDRLRTVSNPDKDRFPQFTQSLRVSLFRETVEFFHSLVQENQSAMKLIDANYTFVNEELARHYGIGGVTGSELQRVVLTDPNRGGVLGMGSILTATSLPLRTSPVLRGKWILEEILGTPPPPPPQNAGQLPADDKDPGGLTFRQLLEKHRKASNCSGCHAKLDPLGFGLENFDPIGRWRTEIAGKSVDSAGELTTGERFSTPKDLKAVLLSKKQLIIRNLVERTLAFALGRGLEFYDEPTVSSITKTLLATDAKFEMLILEVVKSYPFQFRRNDPVVKID